MTSALSLLPARHWRFDSDVAGKPQEGQASPDRQGPLNRGRGLIALIPLASVNQILKRFSIGTFRIFRHLAVPPPVEQCAGADD
jgi:hypothetical protein